MYHQSNVPLIKSCDLICSKCGPYSLKKSATFLSIFIFWILQPTQQEYPCFGQDNHSWHLLSIKNINKFPVELTWPADISIFMVMFFQNLTWFVQLTSIQYIQFPSYIGHCSQHTHIVDTNKISCFEDRTIIAGSLQGHLLSIKKK